MPLLSDTFSEEAVAGFKPDCMVKTYKISGIGQNTHVVTFERIGVSTKAYLSP